MIYFICPSEHYTLLISPLMITHSTSRRPLLPTFIPSLQNFLLSGVIEKLPVSRLAWSLMTELSLLTEKCIWGWNQVWYGCIKGNGEMGLSPPTIGPKHWHKIKGQSLWFCLQQCLLETAILPVVRVCTLSSKICLSLHVIHYRRWHIRSSTSNLSENLHS